MYFDNNATTLIDPEVKLSLDEALKLPFGNPSSSHALGQRAKAILSESRRHIASFLKVKQAQIIFTSGGSEGASLCIQGLISKPQNAHIITSEIEHPCVYDTIQRLASEGAHVTYLPVGLSGAIDIHDLKKAITPQTTAIVLMAANNETGVKQDLHGISSLAEQHRIPLIVDGVSYLGKENIVIPSGVSAMFFSGHKIHAPQGIGFVYIKQGVRLTPQILGGSQEFGMRGGTENMLGIIALSKAIQILAEKGTPAIEHMQAMRDRLENAFLELPGVKVNGSGPRICNTTNLSFGGKDGEALLIALDQAGIYVSLGSACSSGALEPSRVLLKMGIPLSEARSSLRFSLSRFNTMEEIGKAIAIIKSLI
jgi:cysteine desulfurase